MKMPSPTRLLPFALSFGIAGCTTTPIYDWRNDPNLIVDDKPVTIDSAMGHLDRARQGYHKAVRLQMNEEAAVGNAFILGSAALLTATGLKASSDVLFVGAAATGTTYTLGNTRLPRVRTQAYLAGIGALNCAEIAVSAVRIVDTTFASDLKTLNDAMLALSAELKNAQFALQQTSNASLSEPIAVAGRTLEAASVVQVGAQKFQSKSRQAAALLHAQVETIDKAVTEALIAGTPDLAQIKVIAGGLGGTFSGILAIAIDDAKSIRSTAAVAPQSSSEKVADVDKTIAALLIAQVQVRVAMNKVTSDLPAGYESVDADAVKQCNMAAVVPPVQAVPMSLDFTAGESGMRVITLRGGTKEYIGEQAGLPDGLTLKQPGAGGSALEVSIDGAKVKTGGHYDLHIRDQTPNSSGVIIPITISPALLTTPAAAGAEAKVPAAPAKSATQISKSLRDVKLKNERFSVSTAIPAEGGKAFNVFVCGKPNATESKDIVLELQQKAPTDAKLIIKPAEC